MASSASDTEKNTANEFQDHLRDIGLTWYIEQDCCLEDATKNLLLSIKDPVTTEKILFKKKSEIENFVERTKLSISTTSKKFDEPFRCVLIGKTGEGKSSLANLLINDNKFKVGHGADPMTPTIQYEASDDIEIIDTPGFGDPEVTKRTDAEVELAKIFAQFGKGIHAFIYVMNLGNPRVTKEDLEIFQNIKTMFGEKMKAHTILIFTHSDSYFKGDTRTNNRTLDEFIHSTMGSMLGQIFDIITGQVIAVDATAEGYQRELHRNDLLNLINCLALNASQFGHGECYTNEIFTQVKEEKQKQIYRNKLERDAVGKVEQEVKASIGRLIAGMTRSQLSDAKECKVKREGHVSLLEKEVRSSLGEHAEVFTRDDLFNKVQEAFDNTIEKINNASFREKINMTFSFMWGEKQTKELMEEYVTLGLQSKIGK